MSEEEITEKEHTQAIKAVTQKFECDYCHRNFSREKQAVRHILDKHITSQKQ